MRGKHKDQEIEENKIELNRLKQVRIRGQLVMYLYEIAIALDCAFTKHHIHYNGKIP
jgi:hypothetical protein